jgi:hypothetical protein
MTKAFVPRASGFVQNSSLDIRHYSLRAVVPVVKKGYHEGTKDTKHTKDFRERVA